MSSKYDKNILSEKDLDRIEELGRLWKSGKTSAAKNDAHERAETVRKGYGYSGGADGSEYNPINENVVSVSTALKDYTDALKNAGILNAGKYDIMRENIQKDGEERLRQAYIKNMQDKLAIDRNVKNGGLSGGMSESTQAALSNGYSNLRDTVMSDMAKQRNAVDTDSINSVTELSKDIAKAEYDSANDRADRLTAAEKEAYERAFAKEQFEYQKKKDALDMEYQQKRDELDRQNEIRKANIASAAKSSSSSKSSSSEEDDYTKKKTWELLKKGVYSDEFPEILGFSEDLLKQFAKNILNGY